MSTQKYSRAVKYPHLAKNLKKIKQSGRFGNYKKMAEGLSITNQHLSDIIHLRKEPSELLVNSMASVFGIPREKLLSQENLIVAEIKVGYEISKRKELVSLVKEFIQEAEEADEDIIASLAGSVKGFLELIRRRKESAKGGER